MSQGYTDIRSRSASACRETAMPLSLDRLTGNRLRLPAWLSGVAVFMLTTIISPAPAVSSCPPGELFEGPISVGAGQSSPFACAVGGMNRDGIADVAFMSTYSNLRTR